MGSISEAASSGSRLDVLIAMRDLIATKLDEGVPPRDLASLSRRLMEITADIEALGAEGHGDVVSLAAATEDEPWSAAS